MKQIKIFILILSSFISFNTIAADEDASIKKVAQSDKAESSKPSKAIVIKESQEFQKVIDEYKEYVATIPAELRQEIIAYRKDVAKLNKEKRNLYKKLSQAGQDYLKKEQEYKKRLPLSRKSLINVENAGDNSSKE